ncbi:MAG: hypothetical protein KJO98_07460 [Rhodothermia bacterium]|nr:hypothetical protein [Rhodothermia bacterium]
MKFSYHVVTDWPPLAWLAIYRSGSKSVDVFHGCAVENTDEWFCEAVWDGSFAEGDFDRTGVVFGSGGRLRNDAVCFVSSMAPVDRLHVFRGPETTLVSNSLPCILRASGMIPVRPDQGYIPFFRSIDRGIEDYEKDLLVAPMLPTRSVSDSQALELVYSQNLLLSRDGISTLRKPTDDARFNSYEDYKRYLGDRVTGIGENLGSSARAYRFEWLASMSRGFDSPTCAALALPAGLKRAVTYNEGRPGVADDALAIGEHLGIDTTLHDRLAWKHVHPCEDLFIAADAQGKEISVASLGDELSQTVLVTGHGGGYLWRANDRIPTSSLRRGNYSGLSMTEFRLHRGFIHLPLPFIGMNRESDILRISLSDEMQPWRTPGKYDQPICARVLDEAGVPRELFGQSKTGLSIRFMIGQDRWSAVGTRRFSKWLWRNARRFGLDMRRIAALRCLQIGLDLLILIPAGGPRLVRGGRRRSRDYLARKFRDLGGEDLAFDWAIRSAAETYRRPSAAE